jgi:hypothetical protein
MVLVEVKEVEYTMEAADGETAEIFNTILIRQDVETCVAEEDRQI